jgi:hypothetical protein
MLERYEAKYGKAVNTLASTGGMAAVGRRAQKERRAEGGKRLG